MIAHKKSYSSHKILFPSARTRNPSQKSFLFSENLADVQKNPMKVSPNYNLPVTTKPKIIFLEEKSMKSKKKSSMLTSKRVSPIHKELKVVNLQLPMIDKSKVFLGSFNVLKKNELATSKSNFEEKSRLSYGLSHFGNFYSSSSPQLEKNKSDKLYKFTKL